MKKDHWEMLEKVFAANMTGLLPLQTENPVISAVILDLQTKGFVSRASLRDGNRRQEGWRITVAGHSAYCKWASTPHSTEFEE